MVARAGQHWPCCPTGDGWMMMRSSTVDGRVSVCLVPTVYQVEAPEFKSGKTTFPALVAVRPGEDLEDILKRRKLGEQQDGTPFLPGQEKSPLNGDRWLSDKLASQGAVKAEDIHAACFLAFLALSADVATPEQVVGDTGIIHDLIHELCAPPSSGMRTIIKNVQRIECAIPGYWSY